MPQLQATAEKLQHCLARSVGCDAMFAAVFESALDAIVVADDSGRVVAANASAAELFGCESDALVGRAMRELAAPDASLEDASRAFLRTGRARGELFAVRPGGGRVLVEYAAVANVLPGRHLAVFHDITARRRMEEERARVSALHEAIFRHSPIATCVLLADLRVSELSDRLATLLGLDRDQLVGRTLAELGFPAAASEALAAVVTRGESARDVIANVRLGAEPRELRIHAEPIVLSDGPSALLTVEDVTDHQRVQTQLLQAQKMEAVGRLAGGIAHDFNNVLAVIRGFAEFAREELGTDHRCDDDLRQILNAADRGAALTGHLLAFARKQPQRLTVVAIDEYLAQLEPIARRLLGEDIAFSVKLAAGATVRVDPGQLDQVFMNLLANARDAMPSGGELRIETAARARRGETFVSVSITDTGEGMDEHTVSHLFEPFFTTKGDRATGLGLATAYGIVRQTGGDVEVTSERGRGTTMTVWLPVSGAAPVPRRSEAPSPHMGGTETILVVEDQDGVRQLVVTILRRVGYQVLHASGAGEAILACEQHTGPIHLVLSDIVLPRMRGPQLVQRLRQVRPTLIPAFFSGYADEETLRDVEFAPLLKPFTLDGLLAHVRDALDGRAVRVTDTGDRRVSE